MAINISKHFSDEFLERLMWVSITGPNPYRIRRKDCDSKYAGDMFIAEWLGIADEEDSGELDDYDTDEHGNPKEADHEK